MTQRWSDQSVEANEQCGGNSLTQRFLDPAETDQVEVGIKAELFDRALLTAAYFDIDRPLAIIDENNIFRYAGRQQHTGAELALSGQLTDNLRIVSGVLFLDPVIEDPSDPIIDGLQPAGVPEFQANLYVDYDVPRIAGLALNVGVFQTGDRWADNANTFTIEGYERIDLGARYEFDVSDARWTARLNIRNVTDEDFVEGTAFSQFYFGAPRTAYFSISTEFWVRRGSGNRGARVLSARAYMLDAHCVGIRPSRGYSRPVHVQGCRASTHICFGYSRVRFVRRVGIGGLVLNGDSPRTHHRPPLDWPVCHAVVVRTGCDRVDLRLL